MKNEEGGLCPDPVDPGRESVRLLLAYVAGGEDAILEVMAQREYDPALRHLIEGRVEGLDAGLQVKLGEELRTLVGHARVRRDYLPKRCAREYLKLSDHEGQSGSLLSDGGPSHADQVLVSPTRFVYPKALSRKWGNCMKDDLRRFYFFMVAQAEGSDNPNGEFTITYRRIAAGSQCSDDSAKKGVQLLQHYRVLTKWGGQRAGPKVCSYRMIIDPPPRVPPLAQLPLVFKSADRLQKK